MRGILADLLKGIGGGIAFALAFLGIGLLRAAILLLAGRTLPPPDKETVRLIVVYIGAFAFAGGLVGLARPYMVTNARTYMAYGVAGAAGMTALGLGLEAGQHWPLYAMEAGAGVVLGCAMAHGMLRGRSKPPTIR